MVICVIRESDITTGQEEAYSPVQVNGSKAGINGLMDWEELQYGEFYVLFTDIFRIREGY